MLITLTTDFGLSDTYAGVMKGVILSIAPEAKIVDLTHGIPPRDILAGALALEESAPFFPAGTIHVAVIDPGVGSTRAALLLETERAFYIGPDNGLFDLVLKKEALKRAVRLENPRFRLPRVNATFHGRDIFSPAAAHLARGVAFEDFGPPHSSLVPLDFPQPVKHGDALQLHVLRADHFGNLVTDLTREIYAGWNAANSPVSVAIAQTEFPGISSTFSDAAKDAPVAYFGSSGRLEIAIREGRAASFFNASRGALITLKKK